jgi:hypothetical protein
LGESEYLQILETLSVDRTVLSSLSAGGKGQHCWNGTQFIVSREGKGQLSLNSYSVEDFVLNEKYPPTAVCI